MYQIFYGIAAAALIAVLYGAAESKFDIAIYGVAGAVMFYFMGAVLHYLCEILNELKRPGKETAAAQDKSQGEAK